MGTMNPIVTLIVGWALGFVAAFVTAVYSEDVRQRRRGRAIRSAILDELRELQFLMVTVCSRTEMDLGTATRQSLEWTARFLARSSDTSNPYGPMAESIAGMLKRPPEELEAAFGQRRKAPGRGGHHPKVELPFLTSVTADLRLFEPAFRARVLDIRANCGYYNNAAEMLQHYQRLTFATQNENLAAAIQGADNSFRELGNRARIIADKIEQLLAGGGK